MGPRSPPARVHCLFLANLAVLAFSQMSGDAFLSWGWRIPFALSIVLVGIGLWIRLRILETPVFRMLVAERKIERNPIIEVCKKQPGTILLTALTRISEQAPFYIFTAFIFAYGTGALHVSRDLLLTAVLCATLLSAVTIPLSGHISDRIGRKKMYMIGSATMGIFGFIYFGLIDHSLAGPDLRRNRRLAHPARHAIWTAGGTHRRELHASAAV
jgi:MFS family permease